MKRLFCATLDANKAQSVEVESTFVRALPNFSIVGLANQSILESRERIKAALGSIEFKFPAQKVTINLSPSDLKKEGSHFDLPIAILIALQKEQVDFEDFYCFGELGLDGSTKGTTSIFPIILSLASRCKNLRVLVPSEISQLISSIPNVEVYSASTLFEAVTFFVDKENRDKKRAANIHLIFKNTIKIEDKEYIPNRNFELDFVDVKGQAQAKEAMMICAAGMHNILLEGSPGCGKSMSIKRLRYILPPLSTEEILESAANFFISGENANLNPIRPFRSPHHTSSRPSIFGGGSSNGKIGEVGLAHYGILFFDEFPHFSKQVLESLREPLEDHQVLISRVNSKICYKTEFLFACAQNPCPCGNLFSSVKNCKCSELEIARYKAKISAPILDRIDIYVQMDESHSNDKSDINSAYMSDKVLNAFKKQKQRGQKNLNGKMSDVEMKKFCKMNEDAKELLKNASIRFGLSHRGVGKVLRVARSIADLQDLDIIDKASIVKALSFRQR